MCKRSKPGRGKSEDAGCGRVMHVVREEHDNRLAGHLPAAHQVGPGNE